MNAWTIENCYEIAGDCWHWRGRRNASGYGSKGQRLAHRWMWEQVNGPIPEKLTIEHACHTADLDCAGGPSCLHRRCVNPGHLKLLTVGENVKLSHSRRMVSHRTDICLRGHAFTEANTYVFKSGARTCRKCHSIKERERRQRAQLNEYRWMDRDGMLAVIADLPADSQFFVALDLSDDRNEYVIRSGKSLPPNPRRP